MSECETEGCENDPVANAPFCHDCMTPPDTISELTFVGDYGIYRIEGFHEVEQTMQNWVVFVDEETWDDVYVDIDRFEHAVLVADGEVIGGGLVTGTHEPEGEDFVAVKIAYKGVDND